MIEPVVKTLTVKASPARAFEVFTKDIGKWWPVESHSLSASAGSASKSVKMDEHVGGMITEILHDGTSAYWGKITDWQPAKRSVSPGIFVGRKMNKPM